MEVAILHENHGGPALDFETVYEAEFGYVWHTLRRFGAVGNDLEDLTQDVFVVVYRRLADFDQTRLVRPWLFGIAYRVVRDFQRRFYHKRELHDPEVAEKASQDALPDEMAAVSEARQHVGIALQKLDLDRRAIFIMHDIDGHGMPEIAEELSLPLNTAYSRLRLARRDFTKAIRALKQKGGAS